MREQFCPLTEAKCVREDCVCCETVETVEEKKIVEKLYCTHFKAYLRAKE